MPYSNAGTYNVVLSRDRRHRSASREVHERGRGRRWRRRWRRATVASFIVVAASPVVGQVVVLQRVGLDRGDRPHADAIRVGLRRRHDVHVATTLDHEPYVHDRRARSRVSLTVTDDSGETAKTTNTVTVASAGAATPTARFTSRQRRRALNQNVFFNASTSTAGAGHTIPSYAWDFGDGATGTGVTRRTPILVPAPSPST